MTTLSLPTRHITIAYRECGEGRPLILLHGNSENKSIFTAWQDTYFRDFHSYALDSRCHGQSRSELADSALTIEMMADDVIAFCEALGIIQAFVVGYSDGGNIALFLAKKRPDIFTRVVFISPNYLVSGQTDDTLRTLKLVERFLKLARRLGLPTGKAILRWHLMLEDIGLSDDDLRSINTQCRLYYAEDDMIKEAHFQDIARLIPNTGLEKINDCTHMNIIKKKEAMESIHRWLGRDAN
ncbi:MAG: alpha/beta hydrolase [Spirochaetaceae bacterium]|jgi:pimeloyl-ACP methyl ester carboxylesterase|nr:alpha/beta hydrolase [Spirochaetaceae bacterium]